MQFNNVKRRPLALVVGAVVAASGQVASIAHAEEGFQGIEEVVVTAQRREESLQDTPVAVTAIGQEELENLRVFNATDLDAFAPNTRLVKTPGGSTGVTAAIRGSATINPAVTNEPTVGIYLDGVYIAKNLGSLIDTVDLQRVEVLRGPQGTLYGKNTTGGALNLVTRKPSGEFSGKVRAGVGNYGYRNAHFVVDTPALGTSGEGGGAFMASFSGQYQKRDGFYDNVADPVNNPLGQPPVNPNPAPSSDDLNNLDNLSGRIALRWDFSDLFIADYAYDKTRQRSNGTFGQLTSTAFPVLQPYTDEERQDTASVDRAFRDDLDVQGHSLVLGFDINPALQIKSITGYRKMELVDQLDIDGSPLDFYHSERDIDHKQFSQEFQFSGSSDSIDYVAGLYYFTEKSDVRNPINEGGSLFGGGLDNTVIGYYGLDNKTIAAYGQLDWRPYWADDRLTLSVGLRWNKEERDQYRQVDVTDEANFGPSVPNTTAKKTYYNTSPAFIASWQQNDNLNFYGKISQGWKAGGFNGEAQTADSFANNPYQPETVDAFEAGFKSQFWDNRIQLNMAAFLNNIKDLQVAKFTGDAIASSVLTNAGKAQTRGVETELLVKPNVNWTFGLNWGYLLTDFKEFDDPLSGADISDTAKFPYAPRHTVNTYGEFLSNDLGLGQILARLDYRYLSPHDVYFDAADAASTHVSQYRVFDGRLAWTNIGVGSGGSHFEVALWGKNLLNEDYTTNGIPFTPVWALNYFGDPRTYGIDVSFNW